jgi:hypothetical protein
MLLQSVGKFLNIVHYRAAGTAMEEEEQRQSSIFPLNGDVLSNPTDNDGFPAVNRSLSKRKCTCKKYKKQERELHGIAPGSVLVHGYG